MQMKEKIYHPCPNFPGLYDCEEGPMGSEDEVRKDVVKIMADVCPLCDEKFSDALELRNHIITCKGRKRGEGLKIDA